MKVERVRDTFWPRFAVLPSSLALPDYRLLQSGEAVDVDEDVAAALIRHGCCAEASGITEMAEGE